MVECARTGDRVRSRFLMVGELGLDDSARAVSAIPGREKNIPSLILP